MKFIGCFSGKLIMKKWIFIFCITVGGNCFSSANSCPEMVAELTQSGIAYIPQNKHILTEPLFWQNKGRQITHLDQQRVSHPPQGTRNFVQRRVDWPLFTEGLEEADRMIQLAERMRKSQIDPLTTHIPEFENDIPQYIELIRNGIIKSEEEPYRLRILDNLQQEAVNKIENRQVTYAWWLVWTERLSAIATNLQTFENKEVPMLRAWSSEFPNIALIPSINDLDIQAINKLYSHKVFPIGIANEPKIVDGTLMNPFLFFLHDANHVWSYQQAHANITANIEGYTNLYQEFQNLNLSLEQQEMIDVIFFIIWHEHIMRIRPAKTWQESKEFTVEMNNDSRRDGYLINLFQNEKFLGQILPPSINLNSREEISTYINQAKKLFEQLGRQILESSTTQ